MVFTFLLLKKIQVHFSSFCTIYQNCLQLCKKSGMMTNDDDDEGESIAGSILDEM